MTRKVNGKKEFKWRSCVINDKVLYIFIFARNNLYLREMVYLERFTFVWRSPPSELPRKGCLWEAHNFNTRLYDSLKAPILQMIYCVQYYLRKYCHLKFKFLLGFGSLQDFWTNWQHLREKGAYWIYLW